MKWCLVGLLLLSGCNTVNVHFVATTEELERHCGNDYLPEPAGCAKGGAMSIPKMSCDIYVLTSNGKPPSFDDHEVVETLGHELLHCLIGKTHR